MKQPTSKKQKEEQLIQDKLEQIEEENKRLQALLGDYLLRLKIYLNKF